MHGKYSADLGLTLRRFGVDAAIDTAVAQLRGGGVIGLAGVEERRSDVGDVLKRQELEEGSEKEPEKKTQRGGFGWMIL
jgi:hypothetical protein